MRLLLSLKLNLLAFMHAHLPPCCQARAQRPDTPQLVVLVTDGATQDPDQLQQQAAQLQLSAQAQAASAPLTVFAVGVGDSIDDPQLQVIVCAVP